MKKLPELKTKRLILNTLSYKDIPEIIAYAGNKKVAETTLNIPHPYDEKDAIFWINSANQGLVDQTQYTFAVRPNSSKEFIGGISLKINKRFNRAELGYWIAEPFWGQGYATEAVTEMLKFGFRTLNLNKIYATYLAGNPASGKVMVKNRMIKEGELKDHTKKGNVYRSLIQYRLTKSEFEEKID